MTALEVMLWLVVSALVPRHSIALRMDLDFYGSPSARAASQCKRHIDLCMQIDKGPWRCSPFRSCRE